MSEQPGTSRLLSRTEASAAVTDAGWRYVLGAAQTVVRTGSMADAARAAADLAERCGEAASGRLMIDIRGSCLMLTVRNPGATRLSNADVALVSQVSALLDDLGLSTDPLGSAGRSVQTVEIAIDALDIASIRPFWRAILGYGDEPGEPAPQAAIIDPAGQGPSVWFQQMSEPRPQRNRIHLDISVPHDEAANRIDVALDAGGVLVSDASSPAFWVLADAEGNEACITTWQGRDG
jgi:4a-hydroxytetrahydrobiopterin dehydratase